jgi:hypothetical protein
LFFLYRAKKRKKYTSVIARFRGLNAKNRAPKWLIDRSEARFHFFCPFYAQNARKNLFCCGSAFCQGVFYLYSKKNYEVIDWQQDTEDAKRNSQVSIL